MANSYSQIYIQLVFSPSKHHSRIDPSWEELLYKYISGIVQNKGQKMLAINGMPDHIHILFGMKPTCCIADLIREIKKSATVFIKENRFAKNEFRWQAGYGVFSYGRAQLSMIINYIGKQKEHHRKKTFKEEYLEFLNEYGIDFNDKYLFDWFDED